MKVTVVGQKLIKPSTPTPENLKKYKISLADKLNPPMNIGLIFFYSSSILSKPNRRCNLEESLAKILSKFYPLAGRYIKKDATVDCNDDGAELVEAEAVDIPGTTAAHQLDTYHLLPCQFHSVDEAVTDPLLSIQITELKSWGGAAIGVSVSHRLFDTCSVGLFISAWSKVNNNPDGEITIVPSFDSHSLFPWQLDHFPQAHDDGGVILKRFVFNKEAIMGLRSKHFGPKRAISRVRLVSAIMSKAMIRVDRARHRGKSRACIIAQAFDIRRRTIPALPNHACGNLAIDSVTRSMAADEAECVGIQETVDLIGDAIERSTADCGRLLSENARDIILKNFSRLEQALKSGEVNVLYFSDWTKFGFYEADFGWGKPVCVSVGSIPLENYIVLMSNKEGDGVEAWVHMNPTGMALLDQDPDLISFTTSYP